MIQIHVTNFFTLAKLVGALQYGGPRGPEKWRRTSGGAGGN